MDKASGKAEKITVTNDKGRLTEEDIERMLAEAEEFAEQDRQDKERVEARNGLEAFVHSTKATLNGADKGSSVSDTLTDEERETIDKALEDANDWLDLNQMATKDGLDEQMSILESTVTPIMKLAYERAAEAKPGGGHGSDDSLDDHDEL